MVLARVCCVCVRYHVMTFSSFLADPKRKNTLNNHSFFSLSFHINRPIDIAGGKNERNCLIPNVRPFYSVNHKRSRSKLEINFVSKANARKKKIEKGKKRVSIAEIVSIGISFFMWTILKQSLTHPISIVLLTICVLVGQVNSTDSFHNKNNSSNTK